MSLQNERQLEHTREKLARLESRYQALQQETDTDEEIRQLSMESVAGLIKQLKEEIATFECRQPARR